jgi:hypothetical protein
MLYYNIYPYKNQLNRWNEYISWFLKKFSLFRKKGEKKEFGTEKERRVKIGSKDHRVRIKDKDQAREGKRIESDERRGRQKNRKPRNRDIKKKRETEIIFTKNRRREKPHRSRCPPSKGNQKRKKTQRRDSRESAKRPKGPLKQFLPFPLR